MLPDSLLAMARISEINRELAHSATDHGSEAPFPRAERRRALRRDLFTRIGRVGRALGSAVRGGRWIDRTAAAA